QKRGGGSPHRRIFRPGCDDSVGIGGGKGDPSAQRSQQVGAAASFTLRVAQAQVVRELLPECRQDRSMFLPCYVMPGNPARATHVEGSDNPLPHDCPFIVLPRFGLLVLLFAA